MTARATSPLGPASLVPAVDLPYLLSAIIESADDAILSKTLDGVITSWNRGAERIYGYSANEIIGRSIAALAPEDRPDEIPGILRTIAAGGRVEHFETVRIAKDGHRVEVSLTVSPVRDGSGTIVGASTIARDITERRELEQRRDEAVSALRAAYDELETFTYAVSHDLRAPLRSISGLSEILLEDQAGRLDDEGVRHLERVRAASQRMSLMIDALLDLARLSRAEIRRQPVDLSALAEAVVRELPAEGERGVPTRVSPGLRAVGDPRLLRVVLENLIGNAWKFSRDVPDALVEVDQEQRSGRTSFLVRDNGVGFDPEYAHKLFLPFQRLHRVDAFPGHGIGLATVARIVRRHGGDVEAIGEPGRGATIRFWLPGNA